MFAISLRFLLPGMVAVFGLIVAAVSYLSSVGHVLEQVENQRQSHIVTDMNRAQGVLEATIRQNDLSTIGRYVSSFGADPDIDLLLVVDPDGIVSASTNLQFVKSKWEALSISLPAGMSGRALHQGDLIVQVSDDRTQMSAIIDICGAGANFRGTSCGFLYQVSSLQEEKELAIKGLRNQSALTGIGILLAAITVMYLLNRLVTRRVGRLIKTAAAFSAGDRAQRSGLEGPDEISSLGRTIDSMLDTINTTQADLIESQERFVTSQYLGNVGSWEWEIESDKVYWSEIAASLFGYKLAKVDPTFGLFLESVHPDDRERVTTTINASLEDNHSYEVEHRVVWLDGTVRWLLEKGGVVRDECDKPVKMLGVAQDITKRKELEAQLQQAQRMEAVGQLTGGIAHDFNNLLGVMIGNAQLLKRQCNENEATHKNINAIESAVKRGASLTQRLLAFSRQQTLAAQSVCIDDLLIGLQEMLQCSIGESVQLKLRLGSRPCKAEVDPHQFENVILNLIINARDAMSKGGTLIIETTNISLNAASPSHGEDLAPGDYIMVSVKDTGTGMTSEVQEKAMEPFFTTKEVGEGSGLGLSMAYGFVKQSHGHLNIKSEVGRGTTIDLYLPRTELATTKEVVTPDAPEIASGSESILVVEDDEFLREISIDILEDQGYQVTGAGNGKEAVEALEGGRNFDLLFTDMVLPGGLNGAEIAEAAKRIQPGIRVLYTSGYSEASIAHDGTLIPGVNLANKPYVRTELLGMVGTMLGGAAD